MVFQARHIFALIISIYMIFCLSSEASIVSAAQKTTLVEIDFIGNEAEKAGFAQSKITITPGDGCAVDGYYLVYYTDGSNVLPEYDEVLAIKIDGSKTVTGEISDGIMLPSKARGIAVFECETYFLDKNPDISTAVATAKIPESKYLLDLGATEFSFGALSDSHMNYEPYNRGAYAKLKNAMNFFSQENMDIVVIAGDATGDRGENPNLDAQYMKHIEIIKNSNFDIDKVYEGIGNHGNTPSDARLLDQYLGGDDEKHPVLNSPYFHVFFKGEGNNRDNLFIFMAQEIKSPGDSAKYDNFSKKQIDWLEDLLIKYGHTDTNIFIIEHAPFLGYGAGDIKNGKYTACITLKEEFTQTMRFKTLLEKYKDTIVMSGHTHVSFYEDANYSNESDTFAHTVHIGSTCQPCGYGEGTSLIRSYDGRHDVTTEYGSEGYTVNIYRDYIAYTGYNFSTGKIIPAACLLIPSKAKTGIYAADDTQSETPPSTSSSNTSGSNISPEKDTSTETDTSTQANIISGSVSQDTSSSSNITPSSIIENSSEISHSDNAASQSASTEADSQKDAYTETPSKDKTPSKDSSYSKISRFPWWGWPCIAATVIIIAATVILIILIKKKAGA